MTQHQDKPKTRSVVVSATAEQDEESPMPHRTAGSQVESVGLFVGATSSTQVFVSNRV